MIRLLLPLTFIIQGICLWHAYKNQKPDYWFFVIVFFPFFGSLLYFYKVLLNEPSLKNLTDISNEKLNPVYKEEIPEEVNDLPDTLANKLKLGDQYVERGRFTEAVKIYESCLTGFNAESPEVFKRLLKAHYLNKDYLLAAKFGQKLEGEKNFEKTDEKIAFAWAMHYLGNSEGAEAAFKSMDIFFSNYKHRFEYAIFLIEMNRKQEAKSQLKELLDEYEQMDVAEKRMKKDIFKEIKKLYTKVS